MNATEGGKVVKNDVVLFICIAFVEDYALLQGSKCSLSPGPWEAIQGLPKPLHAQ